MKKLAFFILVILFFLGVWVVKTWTGNSQSPVHVLESTSNARQTYHIPKTLQISKLGINVPIESVAMDEKGRMDVPKDPDNVAWYNLGVKPGEQGNAVMAGHFDKETGEPAVFYDIEKLTRGDTISITDKNNQVITFSVVRSSFFNSCAIFTPSIPANQISKNIREGSSFLAKE